MSKAKIELLQQQIQMARQVFDDVMKDVTAEQANWQPGGVVKSIAAYYAHLLTIEDSVVSRLLKGSAPLSRSSYEGKTGLSTLPPLPGPDSATEWEKWWREIEVDLETAHAYRQAVHEATDAYLATLTDSDLERTIQAPFGETTVFTMINGAILSHMQWHGGDISCIKGLQGAKGFPF